MGYKFSGNITTIDIYEWNVNRILVKLLLPKASGNLSTVHFANWKITTEINGANTYNT